MPRTTIIHVEGQLSGSGSVELWFDGALLGSVVVAGSSPFAFDTPGRWDVGARNVTLEIRGGEGVQFTGVSITRQ
ncbi:hypothetical protein N8D56_24120 [Devosia sp. A8/3-2]|nr:hypothetical protein N8D56_24120 [Devosia sp. A8/3-2]